MQLPFPLSVVSLYLFEVQQSCASSSSVILAHAALKWLHSFVPSLDRNPFDSEFCRNIIESAKRQKSQPVMKKKPISTEIIRCILDIHNKKEANLKNLRIAALCSLAFAGFFRYDELCNIVPKHIEFHSNYIRIFVPLIILAKYPSLLVFSCSFIEIAGSTGSSSEIFRTFISSLFTQSSTSSFLCFPKL